MMITVLVLKASNENFYRVKKIKKENFYDFLMKLQEEYDEACITESKKSFYVDLYKTDYDICVKIYDYYVE